MTRTKNGEPAGLVTNIQKYTIHDGPGIRTEIFFKGCNMRCLWCSNPETINLKQQLGIFPSKCLTYDVCGECAKRCPVEGYSPVCHDEFGVLSHVQYDPACATCFKCADLCPTRAIILWGRPMTVNELMKIIEEDRSFYERSGGGVTLSGGDVMIQWEFAEMLLEACVAAGIHTCVETALHCLPEHMEIVYKHTDLVITDIKHMDTKVHREYTCVGNEFILQNIRRTVELSKKLVIRTPVVMGYNDDEANIRATGAFIRDELQGKILQYQLIPYRKLGIEKYDSLGMTYPMDDYVPPDRETWESELTRLADMLVNEYGIPAVAGAATVLNVES